MRGVISYAEELARAAANAADAGASAFNASAPALHAGALRPEIAALLARLAQRAAPALAASLQRARAEWDQADSFTVLDEELEHDVAALRRRLATEAAPAATPADRAIALEGLLVVDAAIALVRIVERRLAALLRLRLRSATPDLLPEGRPFLDLGLALHEVAEAWR